MSVEAETQEVMCRECDGTGNDAGMKPVPLGGKSDFRPCTKCGGSGRVTESRRIRRPEEVSTKSAFERWAIVGAAALALVVFAVIYGEFIGLVAVCMFGGGGCL
jgi:hypothetical protein